MDEVLDAWELARPRSITPTRWGVNNHTSFVSCPAGEFVLRVYLNPTDPTAAQQVVMRLPAPPYRGEIPRALWHVSEDATLSHFAPHRSPTALTDEFLVWAVDTRHLPLYWFPRDCPRGTSCASARTLGEDVERFLDGRRDARVHVIEDGWLERLGATRICTCTASPRRRSPKTQRPPATG